MLFCQKKSLSRLSCLSIFTNSTIVFLPPPQCPSFHTGHFHRPRFSDIVSLRLILSSNNSVVDLCSILDATRIRDFFPASARSMVATTRLADSLLARFSYSGGGTGDERGATPFINCHSRALERAACTLPWRACFGQVCLSLLVETYFSN